MVTILNSRCAWRMMMVKVVGDDGGDDLSHLDNDGQDDGQMVD